MLRRVYAALLLGVLLWPATALAQGLTGAGSTFITPVATKWFEAYQRKTGVHISYQSVGSGAGIRQFIDGSIDFGATDGPMTADQIAMVKSNVLHVPATLGADVLTYNLPGVRTPLKFDGATIAGIFFGTIVKWNDPALRKLNPGVQLPESDIMVVHRSDGSGTTYIFTDYLTKVSPEWAQKVGSATSVAWPVGLGGRGNEGVTQQIKQTEGAIGYVELIYALSNGLPVAEIKNAAGHFVAPTIASVTAAASGISLPATTDFRVSITNAVGNDAYPMASFAWFLVPLDQTDASKAKAMQAFLRWVVSPEAQDLAASLHYAPLPKAVVSLVAPRIEGLKAGGKTIAAN